MEPKKIVYCADVIARLGNAHGPLVIIQRLGSQKGLSFPGGKQEPGEQLSDTARREFFEETGLILSIHEVLMTRAERARDPRGDYVSTVFTGIAQGVPRNEPGKTRVLLLQNHEALARQHEFVFDHSSLLMDYLEKEK
jgi:ADP-ribose pyrophosphatase YjhB (NUDIX family)